ncbi:MAG: gamma-glutamyl-gamma-aminobutyrate hydrolase family protein [Anaerolineae bacterium]|nr:gamma-glutamyl-gamma-aminobutyrate hydrolase family protein [Anaerolineae bacterium]
MMKPIIACTMYRQDDPPQGSALPKMALTAAYLQAIMRVGGIPIMLPLGLSEADLVTVLAHVDGVLLPGGGDMHPRYYDEPMSDQIKRLDEERDWIELAVTRLAVVEEIPLLAICRGHQLLNVALGGSLWADIPSQMPGGVNHDFDEGHPPQYQAHSVMIEPVSLLAEVLGTTETAVNSLHHQGIKVLAPSLRASAFSPDGLIEAVEIPEHPFAIGVQWHPEWLLNESAAMVNLFDRFVQAAGNGRS